MTLPSEAAGAAPGRGRLTGRRVLVVGARPGGGGGAAGGRGGGRGGGGGGGGGGPGAARGRPPPIGNGRAISVLAGREGAAVACADHDAGAAEATAALVRGEGQQAT